MWLLDLMALVVYLVVFVGSVLCHRAGIKLPVKGQQVLGGIGIVCSLVLIIRHPWICLIWFVVAGAICGVYGYIQYIKGSRV